MGSIGTSLEDLDTKLNLLYYGKPGTGKTTGALTLSQRGKVLLINAEAGAKKQALTQHGVSAKNVEVWPPKDKGPGHITYETLEAEVFEPLLDGAAADFKGGIVIDSMTELTRRLLDNVVEEASAKAAQRGKSRDKWQIDIADYGVTSSQMRNVLRRFRDLNTHLVLTSLERRDVDGESGSVAYGPAMSPAIANDTMGLVDVICFTSIEQIGEQTFYLGSVAPIGVRQAKDRFGLLPRRMVDPTAERMVQYLDGKLTKEKDPLQLKAREALAGVTTPSGKDTTAEETTVPEAEEPAEA